jgi:hypothetical protein
MVLRDGNNGGFYGCSMYGRTKCKGTIQVEEWNRSIDPMGSREGSYVGCWVDKKEQAKEAYAEKAAFEGESGISTRELLFEQLRAGLDKRKTKSKIPKSGGMCPEKYCDGKMFSRNGNWGPFYRCEICDYMASSQKHMKDVASTLTVEYLVKEGELILLSSEKLKEHCAALGLKKSGTKDILCRLIENKIENPNPAPMSAPAKKKAAVSVKAEKSVKGYTSKLKVIDVMDSDDECLNPSSLKGLKERRSSLPATEPSASHAAGWSVFDARRTDALDDALLKGERLSVGTWHTRNGLCSPSTLRIHLQVEGGCGLGGIDDAFPDVEELVVDDACESLRVGYDLRPLAVLAPKLVHLELRLSAQWMCEGDESILTPVGSLPSLRRLAISRLRDGWAQVLKPLEKLHNLERLFFQGSNELYDGKSTLDLSGMSKLRCVTFMEATFSAVSERSGSAQALVLPSQVEEATFVPFHASLRSCTAALHQELEAHSIVVREGREGVDDGGGGEGWYPLRGGKEECERYAQWRRQEGDVQSSPTDEDGKVDESDDEDGQEDESADETQEWVLCNACDKWRQIPAKAVASLPDVWSCEMNRWDSKRRKCSVPEEVVEDDDDSDADAEEESVEPQRQRGTKRSSVGRTPVTKRTKREPTREPTASAAKKRATRVRDDDEEEAVEASWNTPLPGLFHPSHTPKKCRALSKSTRVQCNSAPQVNGSFFCGRHSAWASGKGATAGDPDRLWLPDCAALLAAGKGKRCEKAAQLGGMFCGTHRTWEVANGQKAKPRSALTRAELGTIELAANAVSGGGKCKTDAPWDQDEYYMVPGSATFHMYDHCDALRSGVPAPCDGSALLGKKCCKLCKNSGGRSLHLGSGYY